MNSTTFADKDFTIDTSSLTSGDWLDVLVTVSVNDGATAGSVVGAIGAVEILLDIRG